MCLVENCLLFPFVIHCKICCYEVINQHHRLLSTHVWEGYIWNSHLKFSFLNVSANSIWKGSLHLWWSFHSSEFALRCSTFLNHSRPKEPDSSCMFIINLAPLIPLITLLFCSYSWSIAIFVNDVFVFRNEKSPFLDSQTITCKECLKCLILLT